MLQLWVAPLNSAPTLPRGLPGWTGDGWYTTTSQLPLRVANPLIRHEIAPRRELPHGRECTQPPKEKSCYRCGMTGHISRECPSSGSGDNNYSGSYSGGSGGQECYKCGQVGHIARNCSQQGGSGYGGGYGNSGSGSYSGGYGGRSQTCYSCGGYGHMARDCTQGQKCYNCGEVGHVSRDCPTEAKGERVCYKCKQAGHVQAACPN
ncbi:hypothetical protein A7D00_2051 [Trichophyton violaceum]|uniref:CCHC-type domain-containing protein n=1 Tax=Trichophyton violaceum TaxID=34388 RepID=A0A178FND8_TRIVO|nr:hypothetical protein A7D00_2051 [Trichophyton violaceum]